MNQEIHSTAPKRHEQHTHVSEQPGSESSERSPSEKRHEKRAFLQQGEPSNRSPGDQTVPNLDDLSKTAEWRFEGPTPMPHIIQWHNQIKPGSGDRIMDDAHDDLQLDREITHESFKYSIHESKARLYTAIGLSISAVSLVPLMIFFFDPPESVVGVGVVGAVGLSPLIGTLLNNRDPDASPSPKK